MRSLLLQDDNASSPKEWKDFFDSNPIPRIKTCWTPWNKTSGSWESYELLSLKIAKLVTWVEAPMIFVGRLTSSMPARIDVVIVIGVYWLFMIHYCRLLSLNFSQLSHGLPQWQLAYQLDNIYIYIMISLLSSPKLASFLLLLLFGIIKTRHLAALTRRLTLIAFSVGNIKHIVKTLPVFLRCDEIFSILHSIATSYLNVQIRP